MDKLQRAEVIRFLPGADIAYGHSPSDVLLWPYFGGNTTVPVAVDTLPAGEVAVQRGMHVQATNGRIGQVEGVVVDRGSRQVTHVLLKEGHIFGRKEVAVPISVVAEVGEEEISLAIDTKQVGELPAVDFDRWTM